MAKGDQSDIVGRLKAVLPNGWFTGSTPVLDAALNGIASALAQIYSLISYAKLQTRIASATDGFLDLISYDFFGLLLPRSSQEADTSFRARILAQLLLQKGTRFGVIRALQILTGRTPVIFEPGRPADTGAYNTNTLGYGVAGGYGSLALNCQAFVTAFRPMGSGIPNIAGYNSSSGGYNTPSRASYTTLSQVTGQVTDAAIFAAVDAAKMAGTIAWTQLSN